MRVGVGTPNRSVIAVHARGRGGHMPQEQLWAGGAFFKCETSAGKPMLISSTTCLTFEGTEGCRAAGEGERCWASDLERIPFTFISRLDGRGLFWPTMSPVRVLRQAYVGSASRLDFQGFRNELCLLFFAFSLLSTIIVLQPP